METELYHLGIIFCTLSLTWIGYSPDPESSLGAACAPAPTSGPGLDPGHDLPDNHDGDDPSPANGPEDHVTTTARVDQKNTVVGAAESPVEEDWIQVSQGMDNEESGVSRPVEVDKMSPGVATTEEYQESAETAEGQEEGHNREEDDL